MDDNDASASTLLITIVAILIVIALGYVLYKSAPTPDEGGSGTNEQSSVFTTSGSGSQ